MKKFLLFVLSFFLLFSFSFANSTWESLTWCKLLEQKYQISWPSITKVNFLSTYKILWVQNVDWKVSKWWKIVIDQTSNAFSYAFKTPWKVKLIANFKKDDCYLSLEKNISIYNKIILTFRERSNNFISALNLDKKNIYIKNLSLDKVDKHLLKISDWIILSQDNVIPFFSDYQEYLNNKNIVLLIWTFKWFFSKLIIPYIKDLKNTNVYIYDKQNFLNIISDIYQDKPLSKNNLIAIDNKQHTYLPLSYFLNKLIQQWVNIEIIGLILLAVFATLLIAIFRQIIWFSVFWVYTPLLFSILILLFGVKLTFLLFILSLFSNILSFLITKKVYVLYSSKISLNYVIYAIVSIIFVWILASSNLINLSEINTSVILLFFIIPLLTKNLIKEDTKIFSKSFALLVWEFVLVTSTLLFILKSSFLKYTLIAYPDLLWLLLIFVILVGRFSWLQLLEYIRFAPLMKKSLYEEEE